MDRQSETNADVRSTVIWGLEPLILCITGFTVCKV